MNDTSSINAMESTADKQNGDAPAAGRDPDPHDGQTTDDSPKTPATSGTHVWASIRLRTLAVFLVLAMFTVGALVVVLAAQADHASRRVVANIEMLNTSRLADAETALRISKSLGYVGFIRNFKNFVLRRDEASLRRAQSYLTAATATVVSALEREQSQWHVASGTAGGSIEEGLNAILATLDEYRSAVGAAAELAKRGMTAREIDAIVKVSDVPAVSGLDLLDELASRALQGLDERNTRANRPILVMRIHRALGYNGAIHNFKNFILRQEPRYAEHMRQNLSDLDAILTQFRRVDPDPEERDAIAAIQRTAASLASALAVAERLVAEGRTPEEIDRFVKIDDAPAMAALETLEGEMNRLLDLSAGEIGGTLRELNALMRNVTWAAPLAFAGLIIVTYWVLYVQLLRPLVGIGGAMRRLAEDDLDTAIPGVGKSNEIGDVARWLEKFRQNALQKRAGEVALREQEERFRVVVDTAADGIVTIDERGLVLSFNAGAEKIFGHAAGEVVGRNVSLLMPEPYRSEHDAYIRKYLDTGRTTAIGIGRELEGLRKDGETFPLRINLSCVQLSGGRLFAGIVTDISEQKKAEAELRQANDELEAFAYSVAHDLRAPLRWMNGFSDRLVHDFGSQMDERARDYLDRIRSAATNMNQLIDALLKLARVGRAQLDVERVDLSRLAADIVDDLRDRDPARDIRVAIENDICAKADGQLLRVALENLFANAWKFTGQTPDPAIEFATVAQKNGTRAFAIRDNGVGFDMRDADKLFRAFERLHSDTEYHGTGIGLATVSRVIARHGGKIWAESEVGRGSTFYFTL